MDAHIIYDLTVAHLFKCNINLGPRDINTLQAPRCLNPALASPFKLCNALVWKNKIMFTLTKIVMLE